MIRTKPVIPSDDNGRYAQYEYEEEPEEEDKPYAPEDETHEDFA